MESSCWPKTMSGTGLGAPGKGQGDNMDQVHGAAAANSGVISGSDMAASGGPISSPSPTDIGAGAVGGHPKNHNNLDSLYMTDPSLIDPGILGELGDEALLFGDGLMYSESDILNINTSISNHRAEICDMILQHNLDSTYQRIIEEDKSVSQEGKPLASETPTGNLIDLSLPQTESTKEPQKNHKGIKHTKQTSLSNAGDLLGEDKPGGKPTSAQTLGTSGDLTASHGSFSSEEILSSREIKHVDMSDNPYIRQLSGPVMVGHKHMLTHFQKQASEGSQGTNTSLSSLELLNAREVREMDMGSNPFIQRNGVGSNDSVAQDGKAVTFRIGEPTKQNGDSSPSALENTPSVEFMACPAPANNNKASEDESKVDNHGSTPDSTTIDIEVEVHSSNGSHATANAKVANNKAKSEEKADPEEVGPTRPVCSMQGMDLEINLSDSNERMTIEIQPCRHTQEPEAAKQEAILPSNPNNIVDQTRQHNRERRSSEPVASTSNYENKSSIRRASQQSLKLMPRRVQYQKHPLLQDKSASELDEVLEFLHQKPPDSGPTIPKLVPRTEQFQRNPLFVRTESGVSELEMYLREKEKEFLVTKKDEQKSEAKQNTGGVENLAAEAQTSCDRDSTIEEATERDNLIQANKNKSSVKDSKKGKKGSKKEKGKTTDQSKTKNSKQNLEKKNSQASQKSNKSNKSDKTENPSETNKTDITRAPGEDRKFSITFSKPEPRTAQYECHPLLQCKDETGLSAVQELLNEKTEQIERTESMRKSKESTGMPLSQQPQVQITITSDQECEPEIEELGSVLIEDPGKKHKETTEPNGPVIRKRDSQEPIRKDDESVEPLLDSNENEGNVEQKSKGCCTIL